MQVGQKVYTYNRITEPKEGSMFGKSRVEIRTGVIVAKEKRWHWSNIVPNFYYEYIVRETSDIGRDGIAGVLTAAFSGKPESLTFHKRDTLFSVYEFAVNQQEEAEEVDE